MARLIAYNAPMKHTRLSKQEFFDRLRDGLLVEYHAELTQLEADEHENPTEPDPEDDSEFPNALIDQCQSTIKGLENARSLADVFSILDDEGCEEVGEVVLQIVRALADGVDRSDVPL